MHEGFFMDLGTCMDFRRVPCGIPQFEEDAPSVFGKKVPFRNGCRGFRQALHPAIETYRSSVLGSGRDAATTCRSVSRSGLPPALCPEDANDEPEEMIL
jgi:hypothetical protein